MVMIHTILLGERPWLYQVFELLLRWGSVVLLWQIMAWFKLD